MTVTEIPVIDAPRQTLETVLNGRAVGMTLDHSPTTDRWNLAIAVDGVTVLCGRRLVTGVDLLAPFDLGLGGLVVLEIEKGAKPDRKGLPSGACRLYAVAP